MSHGKSKQEVLCDILNTYKTHPCIRQIEKKFNEQNFFRKEKFFFKPVTRSEIKNFINCLNTNKAAGIDTIPLKLIKIAADFLTPLFTVAINKSTEENIFPDPAKIVDKGKPNKNEISNYRPVNVLNTFSKFYEKATKKQLVRFMEEYCSPLISAYRTNYSSQHVIIRLLKVWKKKLDDNVVVGAVLTNLSKAFDCLPHDLLIAKLLAYGLSEEALMYILSYLSKQVFLRCSSILGPFLLNLSINDLFFFILIASVHNFIDDNTLSAFAENVSKFLNLLQRKSEVITDWFKKNQMIVNPDKFQVVIIDKKKGDYTNENVVIDNKQIKTVPSV